MSGIVGILNQDGAPVDEGLLRALTHFLSYRGPDARGLWSQGSVGFGHALLRTSAESQVEKQPASLDGRFFVTADARIDCRDELKKELEDTGRRLARAIPDSELILQAYAAWGEECVDHLRGDFSFAVWDSGERKLFCARDHFGIKPFYYARIGDIFIFSNTLNCVRLHPSVPDELNDAAVLDFLLVGLNCDTSTTTFREVQRLAAGHCLTVSAGRVRVRCYWSPPVDGRIRYRHAADYVEHFQVLLQRAVADRTRMDRAGIFLSGGMDSGTIAATARQLAATNSKTIDLRAYTVIYESLIPDSEGPFARKTAEFLHIPIRFLPLDTLRPFERWDDPELAWPEPVGDPFFAGMFDQFRLAGEDCRVVLGGDGGDNLMNFEMWPYLRDLIRNRRGAEFFLSTLGYLSVRQLPWRGVARRVRRVFGKDPLAPVFPTWIAHDVASESDIRSRWRKRMRLPGPLAHRVLPKGHASLSLPQWSSNFENADPGVTRCAVEVSYPFLDLRVAHFLLSLPPFPWFFDKRLLREAMNGQMPEVVRTRPKTPLGDDPLIAHLRSGSGEWVLRVGWSDEIDRFVERPAIPQITGETSAEEAIVSIRPYCLNFWLQLMRRVRYKLCAEAGNG